MRDGWKKVAISDVCIMIKRGHAPSYTENKSVTVLNQKCIRDGRINFEFSRETDANLKPVNEWAYLNATDTLVNSTGVGTLGRVAFVRYLPEPTTVDSHITIVRPDNKKVEPSFLGLSLNFREADIEGLAAGSSGQTELSREALGNLIITLPTLPEQKRIVDLISAVDSYIEALQQQLESAKKSRKAVLHELLTAGGDGWVETTLGDVAEWWSGGTPKAREPKYYENGTIPWAVIADMNKGIINSTNSYITEDALDLIGGRLAPVGSVLISMYASVGKSAIANIPLATNQAIAWSIPNQEKIIPFYLYLVSQQLEKEISDLARGATQRNINRQMLREFTFQLPPLPEQKRIVEIISAMDTVVNQTELAITEGQNLRSGLLSDLLSGSHEIPTSYDKVMGAA